MVYLSDALKAEALRAALESRSTDVGIAVAKALVAIAARITAAEVTAAPPRCAVFAGFVGATADDFAGSGEIRREGGSP